jgi:hypothetical protein
MFKPVHVLLDIEAHLVRVSDVLHIYRVFIKNGLMFEESYIRYAWGQRLFEDLSCIS